MALPSDVKFIVVPPNWSDGYNVTYEFKTDIITSRSGIEQRRAVRMVPRKRLSFTTNPTGATLRNFKTIVSYNQGLRFAIPEETDSVNIVGALAQYQDTFVVESVPGWLTAGAYIAMELQGQWRQANVISVLGNTVHVLVGLENAGVGGRIYPLRFGRLVTSLSSKRMNSTVAEYSLDYEVDPTTETYADPFTSLRFGGALPIFHKTLEVFPLRPNWANDVEITNDVVVDRLDYDRGPILTYMPNQFPRKTVKATFLSRTRATADDIRRFFFRMKGQRGAFYMPSWERDLELAEPFTPGTASIKVMGGDTATLNGIPGFGNFAFITATAIIPLGIASMTRAPLDDTTVIELEDVLPATLSPADVKMICWLPKCRCASDGLTLAWATDQVASFDFTVSTIDDVNDDLYGLSISNIAVTINANPVEMD